MKFVCNGTVLSDAALTVSKACAVKTTTPIYECIKIKAANDSITLVSYDGEISIEQKVLAEIMEEGELCVNGKTFADFINKISEFEVMIASNEKGIMIKYGEGETYMQAVSADEFPKMGERNWEDKAYFETKENDLKGLISEVVFCCATDGVRPILKGCLLETKEGKLTATALDGFRMATSYCDASAGKGDLKIICPARTLTEISRMLNSDEYVKIYTDKNVLSVGVADTVITSRLYLGEFVKKENIYPIDFTTKAVVRRAELIDSIERASVFIRGDKHNLIVLNIKLGKVIIKANSDMGKVEEIVSADVNGKELEIAMNSKYILDALKALDEENVVLSFNSPVSPFTLENENDNKNQYLILPVRVGSAE
ncbi:MAG: DNA polymerase III subunit beta [Clostridiales bacterium]|nr:DNA polymerase III subunit beta [Clostridiales bacterium]